VRPLHALLAFVTFFAGVSSKGIGTPTNAADNVHAFSQFEVAARGQGGAGTSGSRPREIATWADGPGACPKGEKRVEIAKLQDLEDASRGEGRFAMDPPETCYLIKNGTYVERQSPVLWVRKGGSKIAARRFVGESRSGVVIRGRANIVEGSDHVVIENLSFDLAGFSKQSSFNTMDVAAADVTISHVTFTGDCATGSKGGHIEVVGGRDVLIDSCIVEKFGHCGPRGHEDHGVYLAFGTGITIRNSIIRGNSSRGILFNTQQGSYGKIKNVVVEYNRICDNGHANYEDGIAVSMQGTGNVDDVMIRNNLIYGNYYSGLRFVGTMTSKFLVERNTFYANGARSTASGRSDLNLDDTGSGAKTTVTKNVFVGSKAMLNDCYDATSRGFRIKDNVLFGARATTGGAACVSGTINLDPQLVMPGSADFHARSLAADGYGAY
jgi:hypothetical protein